MSEFNECLRNGSVNSGNDFKTLKEAVGIFGLTATRLPYHNWFKIPGKENTIGWLVTEDGGKDKSGGQWRNVREFGSDMDSRGWNEILTIREFNDCDETTSTSDRIAEELAMPQTRYVFWRESRKGTNWYKFYGVFAIDVEATRATRDTERPCVVYRRISKVAECRKAVALIPLFLI